MLLVCGIARDRVPAAFGDHLGAGLDDRAALDELLDELVLLEPHERVLRVEVVVLPVEADDHADGEVVLLAGVDDAAAEHAGTEDRRPDRIAHRVDDPAARELVVLLGRDLDQLLDAEREELGRLALEARLLDEPLGDQAVAAFGQDDELRLDRLAFDVVGLLVAFLVDALIDELDARGDAVAVEDHVVGGKARQDLDAHAPGDPAQPLREPADGDGVVAVMDHLAEAQAHAAGHLDHGEDPEAPSCRRAGT